MMAVGGMTLSPSSVLAAQSADADSVQNNAGQDDYKALVCLFLYGGNDSWNLMFPVANEGGAGADAGRGFDTFAERRGELACNHKDLVLSSTDFTGGNPYPEGAAAYGSGFYALNDKWGMNACAPELATLFKQQRLAMIANTGVLTQPLTRSSITESNRPYFLYAHNHQQRALATANAMQRVQLGWAGRLADGWQPDSSTELPLAISWNKPSLMTAGDTGSGIILPARGPLAFANTFGADQKLNGMGEAMMALANVGPDDAFSRLVGGRYEGALDVSKLLRAYWNKDHLPWGKGTFGSYGEPLFSLPEMQSVGLEGSLDMGLLRQLEATARLIDIGRKVGKKRQVFFVSMGGVDTHAGQKDRHPVLLRSLSIALWHFQKAMAGMGLEDQVTLFSQSDFGRTLSMNNDGTDHGWSGNQLVMGGAVNAGVYGAMPDIRENSEQVMPDKRGRIIPDIAAEQITADLLRWMDVPADVVASALPMLAKFEASPKDGLGLMKLA